MGYKILNYFFYSLVKLMGSCGCGILVWFITLNGFLNLLLYTVKINYVISYC